jgi:hypothetical protein
MTRHCQTGSGHTLYESALHQVGFDDVTGKILVDGFDLFGHGVGECMKVVSRLN